MKCKHILAFCAAILAVILLCVGSFTIGHKMGAKHAVEDAELWVLEFNDEEVEEQGYDLRIWIDLDGNWYDHFAWIG